MMNDSQDPNGFLKTEFKLLLQEMVDLESDLGVVQVTDGKVGLFLTKLFNEPDDWSLFVKLVAYFEGILSHLLSERLSEDLADEFSHLPFADGKSGKIQMAWRIGFLENDFNRKYLIALTQVRNMYAHRVTNMNLSLVDLHAKYPTRINLGHLIHRDHIDERDPVALREWLVGNALSTLVVLLNGRRQTMAKKQRQEHSEKAMEMLKEIVSKSRTVE